MAEKTAASVQTENAGSLNLKIVKFTDIDDAEQTNPTLEAMKDLQTARGFFRTRMNYNCSVQQFQ